MTALEIIHNTLLGEFVRNHFPGTEGLLTQVEKLLAQLYRRRGDRNEFLQS